ncbi:MAG: cobyrinate a,c-diamide synthase [Alphaproteobacteria bacterium]|jgi:cobyrinic acid a,c-diamide synthase|nr:cobyrinate a,c-diamide synthase [Alphaproteobacteria bacterium]MBT4020540.1 cobyrinate a,c-diamide synthase [Alphaproteobacteria bacterium]MBT4967006.1 cobyrinate a,c-diamide synthase [Alphaproteobacteria bacterium]MBT5160524.1 cobyrinate a,c-diamide synthase [Alphaproteobacteria bacterium]MBT5920361.1 cobyrinate a,c-diamide synthase [Alphaproteobacteria bacterium]
MTHFLVSAAHKSSGKTTISLGLCAAFAARGRVVQPFKKGPDYIDPMWLGRAAGRPCHNLDFYTQSRDEITDVYRRISADADVTVVEGNKGLHDGMDPAGSDSTGALANHLGLPVVLVIDTQGITRGVAPLILGYQAFDPDLKIAGVILNKVAGDRHEGKLHAAVGHYTDIPVLGAVHRSRDLEIEERHIGLTPTNEDVEANRRIKCIADHISEHVDLGLLLAITRDLKSDPAPAATVRTTAPVSIQSKRVRLGVARDAAFGFYYEADLQALTEAGADLIFFDTLKDNDLPDVDGLIFSGGFPETQMEKLEANSTMRAQIAAAIENGMPAYAECGGLMYLARQITWRGKTSDMVGVIGADVVMEERPVGRGYVRLSETDGGLWPITGSASDAEIPAHEFHYSRLENLDPGTRFAYEVKRGTGVDGVNDGIVYRNLLASYAHFRDVEDNQWTSRFVDFVRQVKQSTTISSEKRANA